MITKLRGRRLLPSTLTRTSMPPSTEEEASPPSSHYHHHNHQQHHHHHYNRHNHLQHQHRHNVPPSSGGAALVVSPSSGGPIKAEPAVKIADCGLKAGDLDTAVVAFVGVELPLEELQVGQPLLIDIMKPTAFDDEEYSTNLNIPTRTTSTLTPTMLRNIADSFMEYDNEVQPPLEHQMAAGFAPPSVIVQQSFTTGSGGSSAAAAAAATTSGAAITTVGGSAAAASSSSLSLSSPPSAIPADVHRTGSLMTSGGQLTVLGGVAVTSSSSSPDSNGSGGLVLDSESSVKQEIIEEDAGWGQTPWANPNSLLPTSIATSTAIGDISDNANSNVGFQPSQLDYPQPSDVIRTASVTSIAPSIAPVISQANCNNDILSGVGGEKQRDGGGGCGGGGGNACTGSSNFTGPDHTGQSLANGARTKTGHSSTTTTTTSRRRIKDERVPPEEEERRRQRRERNKVAAARCRQRRVDQTNDLQLKVDKLEDTQKELRGELDYLKQAKKELEVLLQQHACVRQRQLGIGGHASRVPISTAAGCMPPVSTSSMSVAASLPTISSGTGNSQTTNTTTRSSTMSASSLMSQGAGTGGSAVLSTTSSSSTPLVSSSSSSLIMTAPMATSCSLADAHLSASGLHNHHQHQSQQQQQQQQHQPLSSVPVSTPTQVKVIVRCKDSLDSRLGEVAVTPLTPQPQLQMTEKRARPSSLAVNMFAETGVAVQTPTEGMYSFEGLVEGTGLTPGATPVATPVAFSPSCTTQQQRSHSSDSMQTPETPRKLVTL